VSDLSSATDLLSIHRVMYDYAWGCDSGDLELLRSLFTEDARLDYSQTRGGPVGGRDDAVSWLQNSLEQLAFIQHLISNFRIEVSGDRAAGRAMFHTSFCLAGKGDVMVTGGYYNLELVRTPDGWKVQSLIEEVRWVSSHALPGSQG
jgi:hypothetical protein